MINIEKQIDYWQTGSENDFESAKILLDNKKYVHGLFFCHLSVEKIIKALIVKNIGEIPPKSHDLFYLSKLAEIELTGEQEQTAQILMKYQLEGRYPEYYPKAPDLKQINHHFEQTKQLLTWFRKKL